MSTDDSPPTDLARAALVHREFVQLLVLLAIAIAGFFVTRVIAASNRDLSVRDAVEEDSYAQPAGTRSRKGLVLNQESCGGFAPCTRRSGSDFKMRFIWARACVDQGPVESSFT